MCMKKIVVYPASRVYYNDVIPAVNSCLANGNVDEIVIMIEDDVFPRQLPDRVRTMNISTQPWFRMGECPNYRNLYSHMCLVRVALAKLFPDAGEILSLDADTIVLKDLSDLFSSDLTDYYLAGVPEELLSEHLKRPYINMGMALFNLDKIRADHKDDEMIEDLNHTWYQWVEQDCINTLCYPKILPLGSEYNASQFTARCDDPVIRHFAFERGWQQTFLVKRYAES